jgi:hypothetical protein
MTAVTKSTRQKLYFSAMIFAFTWMIIGDLVSFHLELILGDNQNHWHHPFAKTQKNDSKTYKVKSQKTDDSSKSGHSSFIGEKPYKLIIHLNEVSIYNVNTRTLLFDKIFTLFLRGPPVFS